MRLLALYLRDELEISDADAREEMLYAFCKEKLLGYNKVLHFPLIDKALEDALDPENQLIVVDKIEVTKNEVDCINKLTENKDYRKLLFTFLIQMRLNKIVSELKNKKEYTSTFFKGGAKKYNAMKQMSNTSPKIKINDNFVHDMNSEGIIQIYHNGLINLLFLEDCIPGGDVVIQITDFDDVGWYLDEYNGEPGIVRCKYSDHPFKQTKHDISYCSKHKQYYIPIEIRTIKCVDCGIEFLASSKANNCNRCEQCAKTRLRQQWRSSKSRNSKGQFESQSQSNH